MDKTLNNELDIKKEEELDTEILLNELDPPKPVTSAVETPKKEEEFEDVIDDGISEEELKEYELEDNDIKPDYSKNPDYDKMVFDDEGNLVSFINKIELATSSPVDDFNFDDVKLKHIFFGKTDISVQREKDDKPISLLDALDVITKSGEYVDTYLPMSNLVVRTYEFENDIVMGTTLGSITQDYDFKNNVNPNAILSKRFINKIVEYSEIISSDSRKMTEDDLEKISNKDIELLILNVAKLLSIDYTKDEDNKEPITAEIHMECPNCGNRNKLIIDFDKLLKQNYTKEVIEFANKNLKLGETIESNLARSHTMHIRGCRFVSKNALGNGTDLMLLVKIKDPSYAKSLLIENRILPYILNKYESNPFFSELVSNNNYLSSPLRGKLTLMFRYIRAQLRYADLNDSYTVSVDFSQDLDMLYVISYVDSILSVISKSDGKDAKASDKIDIIARLKEENTLENPNIVKDNIEFIYNSINKLPKELLTRLRNKISELEKESIFKFTVNYTCALSKCGYEGEKEILPIDLVFSILQKLSEK